ncbi:MAG: hypothetical protein KJN80_07730, partial [Deltaproteobacteria bacterium]|nr:hypothetical protein [Deltaproteobacteria bacterium]
TRTIYNYFTFALSILVFVLIYVYTYFNNDLSIERTMLSILAYLQSLLAVSVILIIGALFRNLILFRKKR